MSRDTALLLVLATNGGVALGAITFALVVMI